VVQGDRGPVEVVYVVANGPSPTPFINDPLFFVIKVEDLSGRLVSYTGATGPVTGSWGAQTHIVLPASAILAQVEDLRCINDMGYARAEGPFDCVTSYNLDVAGSYRVIVEYHGFDTSGTGPVLADTVPLMVR
jgi:hypothetical protein